MFEDFHRANPQAFKDFMLWGADANPEYFEPGTLDQRQRRLDRKFEKVTDTLGEKWDRKLHYFIDRYNTLYFELGMKAGIMLAQGLELGKQQPEK